MAEPTAREQLMLELINRARRDPAAEAERYGIDLNAGLSPGTISADPKQPLAWNSILEVAARGHSQFMLDEDVFSHTGAGGSSSHERMIDAGYEFTGSWRSGENLSWRGTTATLDAAQLEEYIILQHQDLFESSGHRVNLMQGAFREVGISQLEGKFLSGGTDFNASMITQNFAKTGTASFLTGVIFRDSDGDDFYSVGEGQGGITITATGTAGTFTTTSMGAGGYQMPLPSGSYTVTFTGTGIGEGVTTDVEIGAENIRVAYDTLNRQLDTPSGIVTVSEGDNGVGNGGTAGSVIVLGATNDRFQATGAGDDTINGGAGLDTVVLASASGANTVSFSGNEIIVAGPAGRDSLTGVERIEFTDRALAFDDDAAQVFRLYQAAFGRTPDEGGIGFWLRAKDDGLAIRSMASEFIRSAEFESNFGTSLSDGAFVDQLYQNVLGRAGEEGGRTFWVNTLAAGEPREAVLVGFTDSPENISLTQASTDSGVWFGLG